MRCTILIFIFHIISQVKLAKALSFFSQMPDDVGVAHTRRQCLTNIIFRLLPPNIHTWFAVCQLELNDRQIKLCRRDLQRHMSLTWLVKRLSNVWPPQRKRLPPNVPTASASNVCSMSDKCCTSVSGTHSILLLNIKSRYCLAIALEINNVSSTQSQDEYHERNNINECIIYKEYYCNKGV